MKIEVGKTYKSKIGEQWRIVYKLDDEDDSYTYLGEEASSRFYAYFDGSGVSRSGSIRLVNKIKEPKLRPFTRKTFPLDAWLRKKDRIAYHRALYVDTHWIGISDIIGGDEYYNWQQLLENFEYSIDGCKTWHPCGVKE